MDDSVDPDFRALPEAGAVEDGRAHRNEDLVLDDTADQVRRGSNQAVPADASGMTARAAHHGILHDDAVVADLDSTTLGDDRGAVHDSAVCANRDVTTDGCGGRDVGARLNSWALAEMSKEHVLVPTLWFSVGATATSAANGC
jgi:hypothetical protein